MNRKLLNRKSAYLGMALIVVGILFNRRFIEVAFIPDQRIESHVYVAAIYVFQLLAIVAGAWLLIKQPSIRLPGKTEVGMLVVSTSLTFILLELVARVWLNYMATPEQHDRFVLYTSLKPSDFAFTPHPYLSYYPTPNYHKGQTSHNSLGYRGDEFPLKKPEGVYR